MYKSKQFLAYTIALSLAIIAGVSQSEATQPAVQNYSDPFVQQRKEMHEARLDYESGKISVHEYEKKRADASARLQASGERGIFERNLEVRQAPGTSRAGK
ncbi:MAG TPA: hypothetical protein VEC35_01475 [Noviherbaspirillum sp.]|nr:hypothetical protein [Noviherbaspirillum sp.]